MGDSLDAPRRKEEKNGDDSDRGTESAMFFEQQAKGKWRIRLSCSSTLFETCQRMAWTNHTGL